MHRISSFKLFILLVTFATLFATPCVKAQDPNAVREDLKSLTTATNDLQQSCNEINVFNVGVLGPRLVSSITVTVATVRNVARHITVTHPIAFSDEVAAGIVVLLDELVETIQHLLRTLTGKHGLLFGLRIGIRTALQALGAALDTLLEGLIKIIPTRRDACNRARHRINISVKACITVYS